MNIDKTTNLIHKFNVIENKDERFVEVKESNFKKITQKATGAALTCLSFVVSDLLKTRIVRQGTNFTTGSYALGSGLVGLGNLGLSILVNPLTTMTYTAISIVGVTQLYQLYSDLTNQIDGNFLVEQSNVLLQCAQQFTDEQKENIKSVENQTTLIFKKIEDHSKKMQLIGEFSKNSATEVQEFKNALDLKIKHVNELVENSKRNLSQVGSKNKELDEKAGSVAGTMITIIKFQRYMEDLSSNKEPFNKASDADKERALSEARVEVEKFQKFCTEGINDILRISEEIQNLVDRGHQSMYEVAEGFHQIDKEVNNKFNEVSHAFLEIQRNLKSEEVGLESLQKDRLILQNTISEMFNENACINDVLEKVLDKNNEISMKLNSYQNKVGGLSGFIFSTAVIGSAALSIPTLFFVSAGISIVRNSKKISNVVIDSILYFKGVDKSEKKDFISDRMLTYRFDKVSSGIVGSLRDQSSTTCGDLVIDLGSEKQPIEFSCKFNRKNREIIDLNDIENLSQVLKKMLRSGDILPQKCLDCLDQLETQLIFLDGNVMTNGLIGTDGKVILKSLRAQCLSKIDLELKIKELDVKEQVKVKSIEVLKTQKENAEHQKKIMGNFL